MGMVYNLGEEKPVVWLGSSRPVVRSFPAAARSHIGRELYRLQLGHDPTHWRPMPSVGRGAREIRVRTADEGGRVDHRVFYVASTPEAIYVLHAFQKKTPKTARRDLDVARRRYAEMESMRSEGNGQDDR